MGENSDNLHSIVIREETWRRGTPLYTFKNREKVAISSAMFENIVYSVNMPENPSYSTLGGFIQTGDSISYVAV